jgi:hypothetical protein
MPIECNREKKARTRDSKRDSKRDSIRDSISE